MRIAVGLVLGLLLLGGAGAAYLYGQVNELSYEHVAGDVYVIHGLGGNVGVLKTSDGAVVVDSLTFVSQGEGVRALAEELGGGPVRLLLNTHYHGDHTHGNPAFDPSTRFVATTRTLEHLRHFDAPFWEGPAAATLPVETFEDTWEATIGGKTIRAHHLGRGHTDGDLVVEFVEDRVLHMGDLFFNRQYPNIDLEGGGSLRAWSGTLDRALALDFDRVIPGHGPTTDAEGIRAFQRFVVQLWGVGEAAAKEGRDLATTIREAPLDTDEGYATMEIPFVMKLDREFVLTRSWEEATGAVTPENPPAR